MSDTYLRNLNLQIQVENMGLNSWGGEKRREPNRDFNLPSIETLLSKKDLINRQQQKQDQIQLYLEKEKRPVVVGGVEYKFNQVTEPQLISIADIEQIQNDVEQFRQNVRIHEGNIELLTQNYYTALEAKEQQENLLNEKQQEKSILDGKLNEITTLLPNIEQRKTLLEGENQNIDNDNTLYFAEVKLKTTPKERKKELGDIIVENKKLKKRNETEIKNIVMTIQQLKKAIQDIPNDILNIEGEINTIITNLPAYKQQVTGAHNLLIGEELNKDTTENDLNLKLTELRQKKEENKRKVTEYGDELRRLNTGSFNLERFYNETDEEYADRLKINSQLPFDNSTTANLSNIERNNNFKENMRNLFNDDSFIEKILNHYKSGQEHYIYTFNQGFELFKKDYLNLYGFNNKDIIEEPLKFIELVDNFCKPTESGQPSFLLPSKDIELKQQFTPLFEPLLEKLKDLEKASDPLSSLSTDQKKSRYQKLSEKIAKGDSLTIPQTKEFNTLTKEIDEVRLFLDDIKKFNPTFKENDEMIEFTNPTNGNKIYFRYLDTDINEAERNGTIIKLTRPARAPIFLMSNSGVIGDFVRFTASQDKIKKLFKEFFGMEAKETRRFFKSSSSTDKEDFLNFFNVLGSIFIPPVNFLPSTPINLKIINKDTRFKTDPIFGMGLKDDTPEYVQFGKYILLLKKLLLKNILSLHKKNHLKLSSFKNKKVSNEFVNLIFKLLDKQIITVQDLAILKIGEKEILDNLLGVCELNKKIITGSGLETLNKVKEKLNLIQGQIEAGNNNPIMKQELHDVLFQLVNLNAITERQARQHYKNICQDFF